MIHQAKSYIRFLRRSKNKHGIHSPFVYDLTTGCFNDKTKYPEYHLFKKYRKALLADHSTIKMKDYGEGSRIFKGNARKISEIARVAGLRKKRQKLLFRLCRYLKAESVLELGTSLGLGTIALAVANTGKSVETVEGCEQTLQTAKQYLNRFKIENVILHHQLFSDFLKGLPRKTFDLVFIDGDHNGDRTYQYFEELLNHVHNDSVLIFDDIYWNPGMTRAWERIIAHEKVTVSIDTFQWGLVFFRKEQLKQEFVIRT